MSHFNESLIFRTLVNILLYVLSFFHIFFFFLFSFNRTSLLPIYLPFRYSVISFYFLFLSFFLSFVFEKMKQCGTTLYITPFLISIFEQVSRKRTKAHNSMDRLATSVFVIDMLNLNNNRQDRRALSVYISRN